MVIVKKYSNRRLYDTDLSRYVTLEELAGRIREGDDVRVVDAKSGEDLTQPVLAQIILESRGASKLLPASFLAQLIRMDDEDLSQFMGRYMSWALEIYLQAKQGSSHLGPLGAIAQAPFQATSAMARMFQGFGPWNMPGMRPPATTPTPAAPPSQQDDLASLRAEIEALKAAMGKND
ncbi:MAG: polyhydroxyalkanoate synthesis regulator DNA-binding domain-containing protein [Myxococcota bacterium]